MAAEGLWKPEPEPEPSYLKLLPGAAGAPGYNVVQGAVLWRVWPAAPLLSKFWPWDPLLPTSGHRAPQERATLFPFRKA